jgi:arabinose-5-phosphate isomerase
MADPVPAALREEADSAVAAGPAGPAGESILAAGRRVLRLEADALLLAEHRLGEGFTAAVRTIQHASGRVIVSGIGKSGIIARKIAATLTSTGTPAAFLHPVEGMHGDLGMVSREDVAILLSKSGESAELTALLEHLTRFGVPVIALTGRPDSVLGRAAAAVIDCSVREEACPFDLAPTASSTVALGVGDALAVALLQERGFTRDDFARLHPGGALGRKLTLRVRDVMISEDVPSLPPDAAMRTCVVLLAEKRGTVAVVDERHRVIGVVTSGDLTRLMEREEQFFGLAVGSVMTREPKVIDGDALAAAAIFQMETHGIMALPVVGAGGELTGMVHLHDLLRASVV